MLELFKVLYPRGLLRGMLALRGIEEDYRSGKKRCLAPPSDGDQHTLFSSYNILRWKASISLRNLKINCYGGNFF